MVSVCSPAADGRAPPGHQAANVNDTGGELHHHLHPQGALGGGGGCGGRAEGAGATVAREEGVGMTARAGEAGVTIADGRALTSLRDEARAIGRSASVPEGGRTGTQVGTLTAIARVHGGAMAVRRVRQMPMDRGATATASEVLRQALHGSTRYIGVFNIYVENNYRYWYSNCTVGTSTYGQAYV